MFAALAFLTPFPVGARRPGPATLVWFPVAGAVVGAVVAEFVGADAGLGYLIQTSMAFFRTPLAFSAVVILAIMGIVLFQLVALLERVLFPWSSGAEHAATPAA